MSENGLDDAVLVDDDPWPERRPQAFVTSVGWRLPFASKTGWRPPFVYWLRLDVDERVPGSVFAKSFTASSVGPHWRDWQNAGVANELNGLLGEHVVLGDLVEPGPALVGRDLMDVTADVGECRRRRVGRLQTDGK
jgi:hypothetical protein